MAENTRKTEVIERLEAGISQLTNSESWKLWLDAQSRFHHYSFFNTLLILSQRPDATRVAGFHTWRKLQRQILAGEHGLWILAPMTHRVAVDDDASEESERVVRFFKAVPVFDVAQTKGRELPEVCTRLVGEDETGVYERLCAVAASLGYSVEDATLPGETNGDCTPAIRRIRVEQANSPSQRVKTLAHELAHAILHEDSDESRELKELEAESVAYVVCANLGNGAQQLGLDTGDYTFGYVAVWAGGGSEALAAIKSSGTRIQRAADLILARLGG